MFYDYDRKINAGQLRVGEKVPKLGNFGKRPDFGHPKGLNIDLKQKVIKSGAPKSIRIETGYNKSKSGDDLFASVFTLKMGEKIRMFRLNQHFGQQ